MTITPTQLTIEAKMTTFVVHLQNRTCLRKTKNVIVTSSQPASSRAKNHLYSTQSTTPEDNRDFQWRIHRHQMGKTESM